MRRYADLIDARSEAFRLLGDPDDDPPELTREELLKILNAHHDAIEAIEGLIRAALRRL